MNNSKYNSEGKIEGVSGICTVCTNCHIRHELSHSARTATACTYWLAATRTATEWPQPTRSATCSTSSQTALAATAWMNCYGLHESAVHTNCRNWQSQHKQPATCCRSCQTAGPVTGWLLYHSIHELSPCARTVTFCTNHDSLYELATWKNCHCLRELPQPMGTAPSWPVRPSCDELRAAQSRRK